MKKLSFLFAALVAGGVVYADPIDVSGIDLDSKKIDRTGVTVTESNPRGGGDYGAKFLLDGGLEDNQRWISGAKKCNVVFTFPTARMVNAIGVQAASYAGGNRAPKAWTFYGSNDDGATWTPLDTQSGQTGWSSKQLKVYSFKNTTAYTKYKFDISDNNGDSVSSLSEFWFYDIQVSRLFVESSLGQTFGTVTPKWGATIQSPGEEVVVSAYNTWDRDGDGLFTVSCTGYDRYDTNASGEFEFTSSSENWSLTIPKFPELDVKIVWKLSVSVGVKVSAENGAVTGAGSYGLGDVATLRAIPDDGYYFLHWTNLPTGVDPTSETVRFTVTDKVAATAVFAPYAGHTKYVKPAIDGGSDDADGNSLETAYATIAYAVAQLGADGGVVYLADGTYTEVKAADSDRSSVKLLAPVRVIGLSGDPTKVIVKTSSSASRIFELNHPDAKLQYLTSSGGKVNQGGTVKVDTNGGVVEDCILEKGQNSDYSGGGGNLWMSNGRVARCIIRNGTGQSNNYGSNGGGFWMSGGVLEDCLVTKNTGRYPGGVVSGTAKVINCTIVDNSYDLAGYGAVCVPTKDADAAKVAVVNTIISGNHNAKGATISELVFNGNASCFVRCASAEGLINNDCRTGDMGFLDAVNGDYSLSVGSQLRDQGVDASAYGSVSTTDLAGRSRKIAGAIDIGAYEFELSGIVADFTISSSSYIVPAAILLTATVEGATGEVTYKWEIDDGVAEHHVTHESSDAIYQWNCAYAGRYTVKLTASSGDEQVEVAHMLQTAPKTLYVVNGNEQKAYPYDSELTGAATIAEAVDASMDGSVIYVLPTTTLFAESEISVVKNVSIIGKSGNPADVRVESTQGRAFNVNASGAMLANMTMKGKDHSGNGGTLLIDGAGGAVSNCVLRCTSVQGWTSGGAGVSCAYGLVTHCVISGYGGISTGDASNNGIAARLRNGARLENSLVTNVTSSIDRAGGFIVSAVGSTVRNCTIVDCRVPKVVFDTKNGVPYGASGAGLLAESQSTIENCVVVNVRREDDDALAPWGGTAAAFDHCATDGEAAINESCCLITSAAFKDYANGDYTPVASGALYNAGATPEGWEKITDLAGGPRVVGKAIDIGCYEGKAAGMLLIVR